MIQHKQTEKKIKVILGLTVCQIENVSQGQCRVLHLLVLHLFLPWPVEQVAVWEYTCESMTYSMKHQEVPHSMS